VDADFGAAGSDRVAEHDSSLGRVADPKVDEEDRQDVEALAKNAECFKRVTVSTSRPLRRAGPGQSNSSAISIVMKNRGAPFGPA
jgi:hypothetical protein